MAKNNKLRFFYVLYVLATNQRTSRVYLYYNNISKVIFNLHYYSHVNSNCSVDISIMHSVTMSYKWTDKKKQTIFKGVYVVLEIKYFHSFPIFYVGYDTCVN